MGEFNRGYDVEGGPPPIDSPWILPPPRINPVGVEIPPIAPQSAVCLQCAYALRGLDTNRNCPECGSPIRRSLMGNLLEFSSREYVTTLHRGVLMVIVAMIAQFILGFCAILGVFVLALSSTIPGWMSNVNEQTIRLWSAAIALPITVLLLLGWWFFSAPDPAILGNEKGHKPRTIIRVTVMITAALSATDLAFKCLPAAGMSSQIVEGIAVLVIWGAGIAQFFASVLYVQWLAPRIPDVVLVQKTRKYLWQLPLIYVLGMICLGLGPLVAGIMYVLMLNTVRIRLSDILARPAA